MNIVIPFMDCLAPPLGPDGSDLQPQPDLTFKVVPLSLASATLLLSTFSTSLIHSPPTTSLNLCNSDSQAQAYRYRILPKRN